MREFWAERLLAAVMGWNAERIASERPIIQAMAEYKYDEYQQFAPGMHFVESLALWLKQFGKTEERETAYKFVKERLVFISSAEMQHLVSVAYPDVIRPRLIRLTAEETDISPYDVSKVVNQPLFKQRVRQCLFAGLSDGAHVGVLRRVNRWELTHEQILQSHEITESRALSQCEKLREDLANLGFKESEAEQAAFRTVVLLDDFSGSGRSCLAKEDGKWKGKIPRFFDALSSKKHRGGNLFRLLDYKCLRIIVVFYVASEQAATYLRDNLAVYCKKKGRPVTSEVHAVHVLPSVIRLAPENAKDGMVAIQHANFDTTITDPHILKGETDGKFGFADGGLPVVLGHNTPNNSISLLWAYEHCEPRGLFPRVSRHLEI